MNFKIILAVALILIGGLLLSSAMGLQVISEPDEPDPSAPRVTVGELFPAGASNDPADVVSGASIVPRLVLATNSASYRDFSVKVSISPYPYTYSSTTPVITLPFASSMPIQGTTGGVTLAAYQGSWTVPFTTTDQLYRLSWSVKYGDTLLASTTSYCLAADGGEVDPTDEVPDGAFTINGVSVETDTNIVTSDGKLTFSFAPTVAADNIGKVYIVVWNDGSETKTIELSKSGGVYSGTYTLPDHGFYSVKGYILPADSNVPVQALSIIMGNESGDDDGESYYLIGGAVMIVAGAFVLYISRRDSK